MMFRRRKRKRITVEASKEHKPLPPQRLAPGDATRLRELQANVERGFR